MAGQGIGDALRLQGESGGAVDGKHLRLVRQTLGGLAVINPAERRDQRAGTKKAGPDGVRRPEALIGHQYRRHSSVQARPDRPAAGGPQPTPQAFQRLRYATARQSKTHGHSWTSTGGCVLVLPHAGPNFIKS